MWSGKNPGKQHAENLVDPAATARLVDSLVPRKMKCDHAGRRAVVLVGVFASQERIWFGIGFVAERYLRPFFDRMDIYV